MKINEVIESREHIKTYWALKSVNIDFDSVYDELLDIQDEIKEFLTNTK